jgi:hypothetical protein
VTAFILRGLESKVLAIMVASNKDIITESCRKFHNEALHNIYTSPI